MRTSTHTESMLTSDCCENLAHNDVQHPLDKLTLNDTVALACGAPNKEELDRELFRLTSEIKNKEKQVKSSRPSKEYFAQKRDQLHNDLKVTKESRDAEYHQKKLIDENLRSTNQSIQVKNEEIAKLQSNMPYKNEKKLDGAIMRLESQLQRRQVKPAEKKEIEIEIERLKSLKEKLDTYKELRSELDELKSKQKHLRAARDEQVTTLTSLRQEEVSIKDSLTKLKGEEDSDWSKYRAILMERDTLKKEIIELQKRRKEHSTMSHPNVTLVQKQQRDDRLHKKIKSTLMPKVIKSESMRTLSDRPEKKKPYEDEIILCEILVSYLEKTFPAHIVDGEDSKGSSSRGSGSFEHMPKHEDDDLTGIYSGVRRRPSKREKRQRRQHGAMEPLRKLTHHPNVLSQFLSVDVSPPLTVADLSVAIKHLEERKCVFKQRQEDLVKFASNIFKRQRSLEHRTNSFQSEGNETPNERDSDVEPELKLSPMNSADVTLSEGHDNALQGSNSNTRGRRRHATCPPLSCNYPVVKLETDGCNDSWSNQLEGENTGDENCNIESLENNKYRTGKSKVQFRVGEIERKESQLNENLSESMNDKMLSPFTSITALGRSRSLDSFHALSKDVDMKVSCRRASSINDKLGHHRESFPDFAAVRSEL